MKDEPVEGAKDGEDMKAEDDVRKDARRREGRSRSRYNKYWARVQQCTPTPPPTALERADRPPFLSDASDRSNRPTDPPTARIRNIMKNIKIL